MSLTVCHILYVLNKLRNLCARTYSEYCFHTIKEFISPGNGRHSWGQGSANKNQSVQKMK